MKESYTYFNQTLPLGLRCGILLEEDVFDQICERDFYFGIAGSGISVLENGIIYKSPYFKPFGDPVARASIPQIEEERFSLGCLKRSIALWQEFERLNQKKYQMKDLPEKILGTNENDEVIKTLKKEIRKWKNIK